MILCQVAMAWILGTKTGSDGQAALPRGFAVAVLMLMCLVSAALGFSWGPLNWIIPTEGLPVETQSFLAMLCRFKHGTFAYFSAWVAIMTAFVIVFLPETKRVPLEYMDDLWRRFLVDGSNQDGKPPQP
ncbi:Sugar transport protein [Musa troglodytarum]|uniref:Sugar transport protein n=1 Tax=Musa troglodytarum TaxID=320322 RepID=A0A9E7HRM4_9LILI|nr:Sugar transport protein [Musa troglodytarum]